MYAIINLYKDKVLYNYLYLHFNKGDVYYVDYNSNNSFISNSWNWNI